MVKRRFLCSLLCFPSAVRFSRSWERIPDSWERMRRSPRSLPGFSDSLREISDSLLRFSGFATPNAGLAMGILSKTHQSSLTLNEGFFLKSPRPSLPLKRAPPLSPSPFPLRGQGMCQPPYSVLKPLRYKVGGPSEVFASSRAAVCGMRPHGYISLKGCLLDAEIPA